MVNGLAPLAELIQKIIRSGEFWATAIVCAACITLTAWYVNNSWKWKNEKED